MNIILTCLVCAVIASSISTVKAGCVDQYGHCKEWSKAGFCDINGYKTYMTVMCAYSCNKCQDHKEVTRSSGDENEDESGSSVDLQAEDISSTAEQPNSDNEAVNPNARETTVESQAQRSEEQDSTSIYPRNQQESPRAAEQDDSSDQGQQPEAVTTDPQDVNPDGVREVVTPQTVDDDVDPRSKIAVAPVKKLKDIVKKLKKTITKTEAANQEVPSGESQPEEMKDIAGEVTSGSKIFEDDNFEPESTSGCASGYGCFSEPGEQVKEAQAEETQELESRSKIDVPESYKQVRPHLDSGLQVDKTSSKEKTIDGHGEDVNGEAKKVASIDIPKKQTDEPKDIDHEQDTDRENTADKHYGSGDISSVTKAPQQPSTIDLKPVVEKEIKATSADDSHIGSGDHVITIKKQPLETVDKNSYQNDIMNNDEISENTVSGSGKGSEANTEQKLDSIDEISKEDIEENIDGIKSADETTGNKKKDIDEERDTTEGSASGSSTQTSIDETQNDATEETKVKGEALDTRTEPDNSGSGSEHEKVDIEEDNIEDALFEKGTNNTSTRLATKTEQKGTKDLASDKSKGTSENNEEAKANSKDLTSPKNKERLTSMEEMINNGKLKPKKLVDVQASTRGEVPKDDEEAEQQFIANKIGKSHQISIVLDQHYYKPYANEDSMAYEMLALDLKKEVERAVGNDALVSQITFSEVKNPGKLPSYSHVLAKFTLNGNEKELHKSVDKGAVGGMMVDKHFFQSS